MMARDDNPFKFDDAEFKGTHKPESSSIQRERELQIQVNAISQLL